MDNNSREGTQEIHTWQSFSSGNVDRGRPSWETGHTDTGSIILFCAKKKLILSCKNHKL
jgi:hypothetical protein